MSEHARMRLLLYDYITEELQGMEREEVERHVRRCAECAERLERMRETCQALGPRAAEPSRLLPASYWENFAARVESQLPETAHRRLRFFDHIIASVGHILQRRPRLAIGTGVAVAAAVTLLLILRPATTIDLEPEVHTAGTPPLGENAERLESYLRQSRALLVGLTNRDVSSGRQFDLEPEQLASRRLLKESRYLRLQPLDARSAGLVNDVEKIMIELANAKGTRTAPDLTLIQSGIRERNLLFKVRMAEQTMSSSRFIYASDRR